MAKDQLQSTYDNVQKTLVENNGHLASIHRGTHARDLKNAAEAIFPNHYKNQHLLRTAASQLNAQNEGLLRNGLQIIGLQETELRNLNEAARQFVAIWDRTIPTSATRDDLKTILEHDRTEAFSRLDFLLGRQKAEGADIPVGTAHESEPTEAEQVEYLLGGLLLPEDPEFPENETKNFTDAVGRYLDIRHNTCAELAHLYLYDAKITLRRLTGDIAAYAGLGEDNMAALRAMDKQAESAGLSILYAHRIYPDMHEGPIPELPQQKPVQRFNAIGIPLIKGPRL